MDEFNRKAIRAAAIIRESLVPVVAQAPLIESAESAWQNCSQMARKMAKANRRGWYHAAGRLRDQLACAVGICHRRVEEVHRQLDATRQQITVDGHDILRDLVALESEFDGVEIDTKRGKLSVTTDAILLEGIDLGRFEIVLDWNALIEPAAYEVIALDPSPAESDAETTHPHVQSNQLCEGEGRVPIRQALAQGRLLDFFVLVRQILHTYNPGSAYVTLDRWNGIDCHDCGRSMVEDDRDRCERCERDVCYECSIGCAKCGCRFCTGCTETCPACEDSYCSSCMQPCAGCNTPFCEECLTDEKCPDCYEAEEERKKEEADSRDAAPTQTGCSNPSLQPVCVG
jgi:hypothetical protein